jgi:hypothetical protein
MGGILLICVLISVYLVVFWSIDIEIMNGKTNGFFGFIPSAEKTLSEHKRKQKKVFSIKKTDLKKSDMPPIDVSDNVPKEKKIDKIIQESFKHKKPPKM